MNIKSIPFNIGFSFDENLREVPDSIEEMNLSILWLEEKLKNISDESKELGEILSILGLLNRMIGNLNKAENLLKQAILFFEEYQEEELHIIANIRFAHVLQWQKKYNDSDPIFYSLLKKLEQDHKLKTKYIDFVYQHLAKSKFDQKKYDEAIDLFNQALEIRKIKNDEELINSTLFALKIALSK